jgi:hypothetical protein
MGSTSLTMTGQLPPVSLSTLPAMDPPHGIDSFTCPKTAEPLPDGRRDHHSAPHPLL